MLKLGFIINALITTTNASAIVEFGYNDVLYYIHSENDKTVFVGDNVGNTRLKTELEIPAEVTYNGITYKVIGIGDKAFYECRELKTVIIPNAVTTIGNKAFSDCTGLTSITIPNSVITIGDGAFEACSELASITIPNSVTTIGEDAFWGCSGLTSVIIPNSVTTIKNGAFCKSGLKSVTISNSVKTLEPCTFEGCGLTSVTIPNSVTTIKDGAFAGCWDLTSVTISSSVKTIEKEAFAECRNISSIYCYAITPPQAGNFVDYQIYYDCTLYVPEESIELYKSKSPWRKFYTIETVESTGIDGATTSDNVSISVNDGSIMINGIDGNTKVEVYNLSGELVYSGTDNVIQNIPQGVYIVKVNNKSIKIRL